MDEPWKYYAKKEVKHKRTNIVWFNLYETSRIGKTHRDRKSISGCQITLNGYRVSYWGDENAGKWDGGDHHTTLLIY